MSNLPQLPRVDKDENYEEYREYLETDGELDLEKVKELAAEYEWLHKNYAAILQSDLQDSFSKVGTHASWVVEAIREKSKAEHMYDVVELVEILEAGGFMDCTPAETVSEYFDLHQWEADNG